METKVYISDEIIEIFCMLLEYSKKSKASFKMLAKNSQFYKVERAFEILIHTFYSI